MASYERNIYNNSNSPWTLQANTDQGNVYFHDPNGDIENGPYTIQGGQTIGIKYTTSGGHGTGTFILTDSTGNSKNFMYSDGLPFQCPSFGDYPGLTSVSLDNPANCDITILKPGW